jgi:uncharacterized membrane protein/sporulation protein YlmC with PRC-barrel domain
MITNISIGSKIICTNGKGGRVTSLVVDPVSQKLTHIAVVEESLTHGEDRLVSVERITKTTRDEVYLDCTVEDLLRMEPFTRTHYLEQTYGEDGYAYSLPYMTASGDLTRTPSIDYVTVQDYLVPEGKVAVHRGMLVEAMDGYIGEVGELLIDPQSGQVTHFLLMKGHGWGKKEVAVPLSMIDRMEEEVIHLNVDKEKINALPSLPVKRNWNEVVATDLELMVWAFPESKTADQTLDKVNELSKQYKLEVLSASVLTKDSKGQVKVHEQKKIQSKGKVALGIALGGLAGLLIGPLAFVAGAVAGGAAGKKAARKVEVGFSEDKLRKINENLAPGGSALFVIVEHRWFNTLQVGLADSGGQLIHERLSDITYDELLEKLSAAEKGS